MFGEVLLKKISLSSLRERVKIFFNPPRKYIFYRIMEFNSKKNQYTIQCCNTSCIFYATITDLVFDKIIPHRLHPVQAGYLGMEHAKMLRCNAHQFLSKNGASSDCDMRADNSRYQLSYQDRKSNICFLDKETHEERIMDARTIVFNEEIMKKFNATEAFHIGLVAGLKLYDPVNQITESDLYDHSKHPYLWIVK